MDTRSHLFLAAVVDRGPKPDDAEFHAVVRQARRRQRFVFLLGDCGYDAEPHHRFLRHDLHVQGIIPPTRGRPRKNPHQPPGGRYRAALARRWPKKRYGQRWQIETGFSMVKRLLGSAVRARRRYTTDREILLRVLTINLMIFLRHFARPLFSTEQDTIALLRHPKIVRWRGTTGAGRLPGPQTRSSGGR